MFRLFYSLQCHKYFLGGNFFSSPFLLCNQCYFSLLKAGELGWKWGKGSRKIFLVSSLKKSNDFLPEENQRLHEILPL